MPTESWRRQQGLVCNEPIAPAVPAAEKSHYFIPHFQISWPVTLQCITNSEQVFVDSAWLPEVFIPNFAKADAAVLILQSLISDSRIALPVGYPLRPFVEAELPFELRSIAEAVKIFKNLSARQMFREFEWLERVCWGGEFWADGYFFRTVGDQVTADIIRRYIAHQKDEDGQLELL